MRVELTVNDRRVTLVGDPLDRLLDALRDQLGLVGAKEGCGEGECGACTVLLGGQPVVSCLVPLAQCQGAVVETAEHLVAGDGRVLAERMVELGGVQCGACTPGIVVAATALVRSNPHPTREEVQEALAGNLCRCTGYEGIYRALCSEEDGG